MRDFYPLSQPCHDNFLSVFKYNIIFALEKGKRQKTKDKRQRAKDKGQKTKVRALPFTLLPLLFTLYTFDLRP